MLKYASKYHSKQKRSLLESRFQYRNQFLRAALFISIFKFGVLNSTMFKGYIFKTLITNLMISKNINSLTKKNILNTATLKSCELYGTTTRAKDAIATYAFLRPQSTCLLFGFFVKLLVTGAKSNINNFEQAKVAWTNKVALTYSAALAAKWKIKQAIKFFHFSMKRQRRHILKLSNVCSKAKHGAARYYYEKQDLQQSRMWLKEHRYHMMPYKSYFRGKRRIYGGRYKSLINVLQRHTNQARYLYKPLYNFNYLMLAFLTGKRVVSTGVAFTKTASFVDQKICFKLADANYVNPFLFFDFLCDAVLTNVYSVISIEHIGGAFTILTKELSFLGIRDVSQKQNFLFYKMRKCVLTTEAQLLN